ncbi:wax synthase family protein [Aspergillus stella-maris]|uniref:wax synthase family protein n=1 Tax=Aspergillus stella-maris TaxID=1810926 RepID=UPI003CCD0DC6
MSTNGPPDVELATICCIFLHLTISSTIAFATQKSIFRPIALAFVLALATCIQNIVVTWAGYRHIALSYSLFASTSTLNATDLLLWTRVTYAQHRQWTIKQAKTPPQKDRLLIRMKWALQLPVNYRRVGTKWQVRPTHPFDPDKPGYIPSRFNFVLHRMIAVLLSLLALHYIDRALFHDPVPQSSTREKRELSLDEWDFSITLLLTRVFLSLSFFTWLLLFQRAGYDILAVIMVALHLSDPEDFPPMQGPYSETWSVRQLWGHTWHQMCRQFLTSNANVLTFSILNLKPRKLPARYTRFFTSFFLSGLMHFLADTACGVPRTKSRALLFYAIQAVAFGIEDLAQWVCKRCSLLRQDRLLRRTIGYIWVCVWCAATWPIWFYPLLREPVALAEGNGLSLGLLGL